jgi:hypothetical protein
MTGRFLEFLLRPLGAIRMSIFYILTLEYLLCVYVLFRYVVFTLHAIKQEVNKKPQHMF